MNFWKLAGSAALLNSLSPVLLTAVSVAEDQLGQSFGCDPSQEIWLAEAILVGGTCSLPLTSYLQNRWGSRGALWRCTLGLLLGTLFATQSHSLGQLMLALFGLGFCSSPMLALSQALIAQGCPEERRAHGMSLWNAGEVLGILVGTALGSSLGHPNQWPQLFLLLWPPALLCLSMVRSLPGSATAETEAKLDSKGWFLQSLGTLSLSYSLTQIPIRGIRDPMGLLILLSPICFALYLRHARRHPNPILPLTPLQIPACRWAIAVGILFDALCTGQLENNYIVSQANLSAGWQLLRGTADSAASLLGVALGAQLYRRGLGTAFLICLLTTLIGKAGFVAFDPHLKAWQLVWPFMLSSLGYWMLVTVLATAVLAEVPQALLTPAAALYALTVQMGGTCGIAVLDAALELASQHMPQSQAFQLLFALQWLGTATLCMAYLKLPPGSPPIPKANSSQVLGKSHNFYG